MAMLQFLYWVVLSSFFLLAHCQSNNILWPNGVLNENQTLVSPNQQFELGFFNPSNSTNQYLGIWYRSPYKTVVWVANGNNPISGGNGSLYLTQDGVLVLQNGNGTNIWRKGGKQSSNGTEVAVLLDSGTLIINDTVTAETSWQSSHDLSNTLLPQTYLGYIMLPIVKIKMQLTSWKSETDPSPGAYVYKLDPARLYELVIVDGEEVTFRTGPWNGSQWNGMPLGVNSLVAFKLHQGDGSAYFSYYPINPAYIFRLVMNPSGYLSFFSSNGTSDWEEFQYISPANRGQYTLCGPYGTSNGTTCTCPDVFIPKSPNDWGSGNFSHGCVRAEPFNCTTATGFVNISNVKLPDTINAKGNSSILNLEGCKMWCMANCSCMAFAILGSQGCMGWFGDLLDTVKLLNDKGEDLYIRVAALSPPPLPSPPPPPSPAAPAPESGMKKFTKIIKYTAMPAALVASLLFALICFQCSRWRRERIVNFPPPDTKMNIGQDELMTFEFNTLKSATNNFSETNKLGGGQFGLVYKGVLSNGEEIAVKRLARNSGEGIENPKKEVTLLAKLRHPNLVKLLGFCAQEEEVLLCYEYMPNRSLDQLLFGNLEDRYTQLYWGMRHSIIEGISAGLLYLHEDSGRAIIHCEIKPSNILLNQDMIPKISDFGLSQLFDQDGFFVKLCMVTSCGHRAPELKKRILSTKSDVYSFGVLILELVTGQRNSSFPSGLIAHVLQYWDEGNAQGLIDPKLKKPYPVNEVERCIHIALLCLLEQPQMRPKMRDVNQMLTNKQTALPNLPHNCSYWGLVLVDSSTTFEDISLL